MESTQQRIEAKQAAFTRWQFLKDFWTGISKPDEGLKPGVHRLLWNGIPLVLFVLLVLYFWSRH